MEKREVSIYHSQSKANFEIIPSLGVFQVYFDKKFAMLLIDSNGGVGHGRL